MSRFKILQALISIFLVKISFVLDLEKVAKYSSWQKFQLKKKYFTADQAIRVRVWPNLVLEELFFLQIFGKNIFIKLFKDNFYNDVEWQTDFYRISQVFNCDWLKENSKISPKLTPTLSPWLLRSHLTFKSILRETVFLDQLHDFPLNSFLEPFLKSKIM